MKVFLSLFFALFSLNFISAQEIFTVPEFPTSDDSIVVFFDASQATGKGLDLNNYTGDLYTHTGVKTSSGDWRHVIGTWGNNSTQPKMDYVGNGLYKIEIGYPNDFYSTSEIILQMNFVFRTPDASSQSEDLFLTMYEPGVKMKLIEPASLPVFPEINDEQRITVVTSHAETIKFYYDGELVKESSTDTSSLIITESEPGRHQIKITAESEGLASVSDSSYIFFRDMIQVSELPRDIETGINYIDDNTVTFALYAPGKKFVYMIGDFNSWEFNPENDTEWELDPDYYMNITPDSTIFWKTLSGLTADKEYRFQYLVDGNLKIADPYADKILVSDDSDIPTSVYPNLIAYPSVKTEYPVSVFETSQDDYNWEITDFERPEKYNLVVYEMLVRDFVSTHSYKTIADTLDYLQRLGINALELMPVMEFEGNSSWGYNTSFYFAPDKYYGTKNNLKYLIDECHKRGIAVIIDIVLNHMYGQSSFVRLYSSGEYGPPTSENPWFNITSPNPAFSFGYDLNHESEQTQELVDRVNKYWLNEYNIDGFRFDFTKGFTNTPGDGGNYDASRIAILKRMASKIWEYDSTAYVILEHFAPDSEEKILTGEGMLIWGNMNYSYNEATMGYTSDLSRISWKNHTGFTQPGVVGYMESHDEERLMFKNLEYGNSSGNYSIKDFNTAIQRMKLAAAFFIPVPGPKMIWQFGELGYDYRIDYNGRLGEKPVRWDYLNDGQRLNLYKVFSELNKLKNSYDVFITTDFSLALSSSVKRIKLNDDEMNVIIIGNFGVTTGRIIPAFPDAGTWYDYFNADSIEVEDTNMEVFLEPGEFRFFTSKKIPFPNPLIITDVKENDISNTAVNEYRLYQNYPNPFNPSTNIKFAIPNTGLVKATIYNILAKEIKVLTEDYYDKGTHALSWNGTDSKGRYLPSGIYFCNLKSGSFNTTMKMVLIK